MDDPKTTIDRAIAEARRELSGALRTRLAVRTAAGLLAALLLAFLCDYWLEPAATWRLVVGGAVLVGGAVALLVGLHRTTLPISDRAVARTLGARLRCGAEPLLASLDHDAAAEVADDGQLIAEARRIAAAELLRASSVRLCRPTRRSTAARIAALSAVPLLALAVSRPDLMRVFAERAALSNPRYPRTVRLVLDHDAAVNRDASTVIHAPIDEPFDLVVRSDTTAPHKQPQRVTAVISDEDRRRRVDLTQIGDVAPWRDTALDQTIPVATYRLRLDRLDKTLTVRLRGGDCWLPPLHLIASERPTIVGVRAAVRMPAYLDAEPRDRVLDEWDTVPEGARVSLTLTASRPLRQADAIVDAARGMPTGLDLPVVGATSETPYLTVSSDTTVSVRFVDSLGLTPAEPFTISLPVKLDKPPNAAVSLSGVGARVTRDAVLPLRLVAEDDRALASARLCVTRRSEQGSPDQRLYEQAVPIADPLDHSLRLDLRQLDEEQLEEGQVLLVSLVVRDRYDLARRNPTESEPIEVRLVSPGEVLASLGDRESRVGEELALLAADLERIAYRLGRSESGAASNLAIELTEARRVAGGVERCAQRMRSILAEAENNRLEQPSLMERWRGQVIRPLAAIGRGELLTLVELLEDEAVGERASQVAAAAAAAVRGVAEQIARRESYQQLVAQLRALLREQRRINRLTTDEQQSVGSRLLFE